MVVGYEVMEDGTLNEVELTKDDLESTKVVCVVDDETKSIYLWKGTQAGIRRKFIGARVATNLRTEYGFHFKVRPLDEGEEPPGLDIAFVTKGLQGDECRFRYSCCFLECQITRLRRDGIFRN